MRRVYYEDTSSINFLDYAKHKRHICEDDDNLTCNRANAQKMPPSIAEHPYLILLVEHEVWVRSVEEHDGTGNEQMTAYWGEKSDEEGLLTENFVHATFPVVSPSSLPSTFVSCHLQSLLCAIFLAWYLRAIAIYLWISLG